MDINNMSGQLDIPIPTKKHIAGLVQLKLAHSLDEYNLTGKKYKSTLKKASKVFATMITKEMRKQKKAQEQSGNCAVPDRQKRLKRTG
jgi:hypothetical protein